MKNMILRRVTALFLAVAITITISACASFADLVTGFADAATYMRGETNVRSEVSLNLKTSDDAKPLSFTQLLDRSMAYAENYDESILNALFTDLEMGFSLVTETYEDTALISLNWLGEGGNQEPLMTLILIDETIYISTELLGYTDNISELDEYEAMLSLIDCDYIKIDISSMTDMLDTTAGLELEQQPDAQTAFQSASDSLAEVLRNYTPKVLTEEYADTLKRENGGYTLTLNAETALALLSEVVNMMLEYETDIMAYLRETGGELGLDSAALDELDLKQTATEMQASLADVTIGEDIPNFDMVYKVSGSGSGANKKQTSSMLLTMPVEEEDVPFEVLTVQADSVTTIMTAPVAAPTGNVLSLEELMMQLMLVSEDFGEMDF